MKIREIIGLLSFFLLLLLSLKYDSEIISYIEVHRIATADSLAVFLTDSGLYLFSAGIALYLLIKKKYSTLFLLVLAGVAGMEITFILKKIFQTPRPFHNIYDLTVPLTYASGYAFPSLHAAFCFSTIPIIIKYFKNRLFIVIAVLTFILIALSRAYVGVHYLSDIILGGIIGYITGRILIILQDKKQICQKFIYHLKDKLEVRRQTLHMIAGLILSALIFWELVDIKWLGAMLIIGLFIIIIYKLKKPAYLSDILNIFEREKEIRKFPGKGPLFMLAGAFISVLLFEKNIAAASVAIMAVGDAVSPIFGIYFGRYVNPLNKAKHLDSIFVATFFSTLAAFAFLDFEKALIASFVSMLFESFTAEYVDRVIDDNVLIPLVAGGVLTLMG